MTVKEAVNVLTGAEKLYITWDHCINLFDPDDALMMDAFGGYKVKRIMSHVSGEDSYEILIDTLPIKEAKA